MRWTKGQEECVGRGQALISQPPSGDAFSKQPPSLILKSYTAELTEGKKKRGGGGGASPRSGFLLIFSPHTRAHQSWPLAGSRKRRADSERWLEFGKCGGQNSCLSFCSFHTCSQPACQQANRS